MYGLIPAVAGVVTTLSFTINSPSTNSQIVCRRKDRDGCGCSRRWSCSFGLCLFGGRHSGCVVVLVGVA